jgi:uncharacterized protein YsxB (DUF464 family)
VVVARIQLDENGCIRYVEANGHAGGALKGENLPCAGVTVLLRTAARLFEQEKGLHLEGSAPHRGNLSFRIAGYSKESMERVRGITDFLCLGLNDLKNDFPKDIDIRIETSKE